RRPHGPDDPLDQLRRGPVTDRDGVGGPARAGPPSAARHDPALLEQAEDLGDARLDGLVTRADRELRLERRLVRGRDPGELRDLAGARLLVETLDVALLARLDRAVDEDLDEVARLHDRPHLIAVRPVRRDERRQRHKARVGEELRDLADPADVLGAVGGGEAEVLVETVANVVAIEDVGAHAARAEVLLERDRDGGLPRAGESREPDGAAAVPVQLLAVGARDRTGMPDDVGRLPLGHGASHYRPAGGAASAPALDPPADRCASRTYRPSEAPCGSSTPCANWSTPTIRPAGTPSSSGPMPCRSSAGSVPATSVLSSSAR